MNEPGVADIRQLRLLRYPAGFDAVDFGATPVATGPEELDGGSNV